MKKLFLIFALGANACLNAQGWVGNSVNNSIVPYNSSLGLSPMNVGIGVSSPSEQLHTNSGVRFEGLLRNDTPNRIIVQNTTGKLFWRDASTIGGANNWSLIGNNNAVNPGVAANQNFLGTTTNHRLVIATGGVNAGNPTGPIERMTIMPTSGFVGVGTQPQNPSSLLTVGNGTSGLGNQANQGYLFKSLGSSANQVEHLGFFNNDKSTSRSEFTLSNSGNNNWEDNFLAFMVHGSNFNFNNSNNYYLNQNNSGMAIISAQSNGVTSVPLTKFSIGMRNNLPLSLFTNNTERIFIQGNGNIGIGTNTPGHSLHMRNGAMMIEAPISGNNGILFKETGTLAANGQWGIQYNNDCNNALKGLNFWRPGVTNGVLFLADNNNVGIGTCAPAQRLHVAGNIQANTTVYTSDLRYKKEVNELSDQLSVVEKISPKSYLWKSEDYKDRNFDNNLQFGFIAQELESILPSIVYTDKDGYKSVNYTAMIPITIQAIKELNAKLEKQNKAVVENEELKSRLAMMEEKFTLLEKTITQLCESGCAGMKKSEEGKTSEVDVLYQSIPNPTDNEALINYDLTREYRDASIIVSSQDGNQLMSVKLEGKKGAGSIKLNLGDLANGTYLYTLLAGEHIIDTKRLQIIK